MRVDIEWPGPPGRMELAGAVTRARQQVTAANPLQVQPGIVRMHRQAERRVILLVEDSHDDAALIRMLLAGTDGYVHDVVHVESLAGAVARLRAGDVDAILLDLGLPDGSGAECVHAVRSGKEDVPIVVLTGVDDEQVAFACIAAGAQDYVSKLEIGKQGLCRSLGYAIARTREQAERHRADALQRRLATIVESSSDAIMSSTMDGIVTSWNSGAERIFGYTAKEAIAKPLSDFVRLAEGTETIDLAQFQAEQSAEADETLGAELVCVRRGGAAIALSVVVCDLHDVHGRTVEVAAICRDVTDAKRRRAELRQNNDELTKRDVQMRALAARLHSIRDEERLRISRTVHDELGQLLSGLKMDLRSIGRKLEAESPTSAASVAPKLAQAEGLVDSTIESVQRVALELRSSALDAFGLFGAISDEARKFEVRTGTTVVVAIKATSEPGRDASTALFRIFQELMTNVARHAKASTVQVIVDEDSEEWRLLVEDDGVGFSAEAVVNHYALGILGMRERAESLGGRVQIHSTMGSGTVAVVRLPRTRSE